MPLDSSLGGQIQPIVLTPSTFTSVVLANSPYSWYRCNETTGAVLVDSSGNGRNGSILGTATYQNPGFSIDGSHSLCNPTNNTAALNLVSGPGNTGGAFTMGMWWMTTGDLSDYAFLLNMRGNGNSGGWILQIASGAISLQLATSFGGYPTVTAAAANLSVSTPNYLWVRYDGVGTWNLYENASATALITITSTPLIVPTGTITLMACGYNNSLSYSCNGYYQDVLTFSSALSVSTMQAIYNAAV
jgi:hypothetical protein